MFDITAIGELLIDFTMTGEDENKNPIYTANPGGAPANFLAAAAKQSVKTAMIARVGDDIFGQRLIHSLQRQNIDTSCVSKDANHFTTLAFVTLEEDGNRRFDFARKPGADTQIIFDNQARETISQSKLLHFGSVSLSNDQSRKACFDAIQYAKKHKKPISFDPNVRLNLWADKEECRSVNLEFLQYADILKISEEELNFFWPMPIEDAISYVFSTTQVKILFVTLGANGAIFATKQTKGKIQAPQNIQAKDTTGAGDIFNGTAIRQLLVLNKKFDEITQDDLFQITQRAVYTASLSTESYGGINSVPAPELLQKRWPDIFN